MRDGHRTRATGYATAEGPARQQEGQRHVLRTDPRGRGEGSSWPRGYAVSNPRLVDTNLIVRYLVQDHEKHAKAAEKLFDACDRGEAAIVVLPPVLAECMFVLESFYERPRADIALALGGLISSPDSRNG